MGKRPVTVLKSIKSKIVVYPYLLSKTDSEGYRGVNFRITNKTGITIDFECYDNASPPVRIKTLPEYWFDKEGKSNGKLTGGWSEERVIELNKRLGQIQMSLLEYIDNNSELNKELLNLHVYGSTLSKSKKRRTKYITIPVEIEGETVHSFEVTNKEEKELLHGLKLGSIEDPDDYNRIIISQQLDKDREKELAKQEYERKKREQEIKLMPTEQVYKENLWNKGDIFQVFALTYFDKSITNDFYSKIVIRLFEYKERVKPSSSVKDFNLKWIKSYFQWFEDNGWYSINTKTFDPLKYDPKMFFKVIDPKQRNPYKGKTVEKNVNMFKQITAKLQKLKLLPNVEGLDDFSFKDVTTKKSKKGTRKELALNKDEFDTIFSWEFKEKDLPGYQIIFDRVNPNGRRKISINELREAREMFVTQVMAGGLRGWHDLKTCVIRKHSAQLRKITFHVGKKDDALENPVNVYLEHVLARNGNKLPFIDNEGLYASLIRTVVMFIGHYVPGFDRDIKPDKYQNEYVKVYDLFRHGYFARKTFAQMMSKELGLPVENIELFTGHEKGDRELVASYLDNNTIENKVKLISKLKVGKGLKVDKSGVK